MLESRRWRYPQLCYSPCFYRLGLSFLFRVMSAIKKINSKAEVARAQAALAINICAARGLQDVLRTNLGPKGTMKM